MVVNISLKKRKALMNSYKNQGDLKCCANCKHSFQRVGLALHCRNENEWLKESSVEYVGICDSFEFAINKCEDKNKNKEVKE